jgi:hypothetical protein
MLQTKALLKMRQVNKLDYRSGCKGIETHFPNKTHENEGEKCENFVKIHRVLQ